MVCTNLISVSQLGLWSQHKSDKKELLPSHLWQVNILLQCHHTLPCNSVCCLTHLRREGRGCSYPLPAGVNARAFLPLTLGETKLWRQYLCAASLHLKLHLTVYRSQLNWFLQRTPCPRQGRRRLHNTSSVYCDSPLRSAQRRSTSSFLKNISLTSSFVDCVAAFAHWKHSGRLTNEAGYWSCAGPVLALRTVTNTAQILMFRDLLENAPRCEPVSAQITL